MKLLVIGSASDSHIVLNSPYVSAYHAEILLLDNGDIILEDKGSRNGTFLNDERLTPNKEVSIKRGDNVRLANVVLDWSRVPALKREAGIKEMRGVGTNFRNRYQLQGDKVSRFHATMKKNSSGKWFIQDHSRNGTTVNGMPIPKDQDIRIKKGDIILCAGVPVPNPCSEGGGNIGFSTPKLRIGSIAAVILSIIAMSFGVKYMYRSCRGAGPSILTVINKDTADIVLEDSKIFERYKSSTVLLFAGYYYEVSAGTEKDQLDFNLFNLPTKVIVDGKNIVDVSKTGQASYYFGTGFFVSNNGRLITNLHIARPWLFDENMESIESYYKKKLNVIANTLAQDYPQLPLMKYVSEVKVEGVLKFIGLIPNGEDFDDENFIKCKVLSAGDDKNIDVALIRTTNGKLPEGCTYVHSDSILAGDNTLAVGTHIYTMGFPGGISFQDLKSNDDKIRLISHGGSITQAPDQYKFGHDASSYGGASGSPIFNEYGKLIGVLNAGHMNTQGFNYGIKAIYAKELIDNYNEK